jgi:anti-sigma B factor antagonist
MSGTGPERGLNFDVSIRTSVDGVPGACVVVMTGELDLAAVPLIENAIEQGVAGHGRVVLDLGGVTFIDSTGLRSMIECRRRHGDAVQVGPRNPTVDRVIEIGGVGDVLGI